MKIRLSRLLLPLGLLFSSIYFYAPNYWRSVWWDKWYFVMATCAVFIAYKIGRAYHWSAGLALGYALMSALWAFGWRQAYPHFDVMSVLAVGRVTAYTYAALLSVFGALLLCGIEELNNLVPTFAAICVLNGIVTIGQWIYGVPRPAMGGLFGNPSISGCLTAFTYPLIIAGANWRKPAWLDRRVCGGLLVLACLVPIVGLLCPGASQPGAVFLVAVLTMVLCALYQRKAPARSHLVAAVCGGAIGCAAVLAVMMAVSSHKLTHTDLWNDSGRFYLWKVVMPLWWRTGHTWLGQGTGISQILVPLTQQAYRISHPEYPVFDLWLWFHSDFVQAVFENGMLGAAVYAVMLGYALVKAWGKAPWLFGSLCGVLAAGIFNFPAHFPLHAFFGAFVLTAAFHPKYLRQEEHYL